MKKYKIIQKFTQLRDFNDNEKFTDAFTALDQLTFRFKGPNSFIMFIQ